MSEAASPELLFFLGAGASVAAGVPDTFNLVVGFRKDLKARHKIRELQALDKILNCLGGSKLSPSGKVDVELLLEALDQLESRNDCIPLKFFEDTQQKLDPDIAKYVVSLKKQLQDYIKKTGLVAKAKIQYLKDLLPFIDEKPHRPLEIFSVNYDVCIEIFCDAFEKEYVDGFYLKWEPETLRERSDVDIKLYKIHGSIIWFQTDRGNQIKLPIKSEKAEVQLITGEKASTLILYPMRKLEYSEPSMELLMMLKDKLNKVKFAIVVGYSFRDNQIRRIFWDAAKRNKELILILISPSAFKVSEERLLERALGVPTELTGRVVCLPYRFESVLHLLKNLYLQELK